MAAKPAIVTLQNGRPPSDPQFWLDAATQSVRSFCRWHVAPVVTETFNLTARRSPAGRIFLPTLKVQSLVQVLNDGEDVTASASLDEEYGLLVLGGVVWNTGIGKVQVTMEHGWPIDEVADLAGIISRLAGRAAASSGNIVSQNAGNMGVRYGTADGLPAGTGLFKTEKDELSRYRLVMYP